MKQTFIGLCCVCIVAASASAGASLPAVTAPPVSPLDSIIPADSLALVELLDAKGMYEAMMKSPAGKVLDTSETVQGLMQAGLGAARTASMLLTGSPLNELGEIFNGRIALVLLEEPVPDVPPPVVVIAHVANRGARLEEILRTRLRPSLAEMNPEILFEVKLHEGVTVTSFHKKDKPAAAYAFIGAYFVIGTEVGVQKFLGKVKSGAPTLSNNADFTAAKKALGIDTGMLAWLDVRGLMKANRGRIENNDRLRQRLAAIGADSLRSACWGLKFTEKGVHESILVQANLPRTGALGLLPNDLKVPFGGARFVPRDFTVFAALNLGTGLEVWENVRKLIRDTNGPEALERFDQFIVNGIEAQLGFSTRDGLVAPLAGELFVTADGRKWGEVVKNGEKPTSKNIPFLIGLKLADKATFEATVIQILRSNTVWENLKVETVTGKYNDIQIRTLKIPDIDTDDISPTFAFLDNYLLFSMQQATVKAAIDAAVNKDALATRAEYTGLAKILPDAGSIRVFADMKAMVPGLIAGVQNDMAQPLPQLTSELAAISEKLGPVLISLGASEQGVRIDMVSTVGSPGLFVLAAIIGDSANRAGDRQVAERMAVVGKALESYRVDNASYPKALTGLVPKYLPKMPRDVFAKGTPGFTYSHGPMTLTDEGKPGYTTGWMLVSPGPDKKVDIDIGNYDPEKWAKFLEGDDTAELKRQIYRYKPELYKDERKGDDEGDLFLTGPVKK